MISKQILSQIEKLAKPGDTIGYTDLNNTSDKKTVSDPNNEIAKAIKQGKVAEIIISIYKNTSFKGKIGADNKGKLHIVDNNGNIKPLDVRITSESLSVYDSINNKRTILQYKKQTTSNVIKESLQDQLLKALKKKKMTDKEVMDMLKNMVNQR